jgi:cytochrome c-type biogenesis protein
MLDALPQTSLLAAFLAGFLSFVSPCVLPLVPSYVMYITGLSLNQLSDATERRLERTTIVVNALLFIVGFSLVFIAFGASASLVGQLLSDHQQLIRKVGAIVIIVFGLYTMGILKLGFLMNEKRIHLRSRPAGYAGSLLIGATFAAGWTPCVGPVLAAILMYASTTDKLADGVSLLAFYSIGLGLPLLASAIGMEHFLSSFKRAHRYMGVMSGISGVLLVLFGIALYSDSLPLITSFLERYGIGSYLGMDGS